METLDYDHQVFDSRARESDKALAVRFFTMPVKDEESSTREGRPIFKDTTMVDIRTRGARNEVVHKPVDAVIKARFSDAWRAYEQGEKLLESGTPLAEWPAMSKSQVEEMKYFGFFTVEHIANARDDLLHKFPGLLSLKQRATAFLELASGSAPIERLQSELEKERRANQALQAQMADLAARMAKMETAKEKA